MRKLSLCLTSIFNVWWTDAVKSILNEFVNASSGVVNKEFWQALYKIFPGGSGGPYITGWVLTLFPYVGSSLKFINPKHLLQSWGKSRYGVSTNDFPAGTVSTLFTWQCLAEEFDMYFYASFLVVGQDKKTLALKPVIGWAVVDKEEEEKSKMEQRGRFRF